MSKGRIRHPKKKNVQVDTKPDFRAFTIKFNGLARQIVTPIWISLPFDPKEYQYKEPPYKPIEKTALWDTGATKSVLTSKTIKELGLIPVGNTEISHIGGSSVSNTFLVNFLLPNGVGIAGVLVSECADSNFDAIIGMDIICKGDFAITNTNKETCMSFRIPSIQSIDYVLEHQNSRS